MKGPWILGMLVVSGVPAIVGGGLMWQLTETWTAVVLWEVILLAIMGIFVLPKGAKNIHPEH